VDVTINVTKDPFSCSPEPVEVPARDWSKRITNTFMDHRVLSIGIPQDRFDTSRLIIEAAIGNLSSNNQLKTACLQAVRAFVDAKESSRSSCVAASLFRKVEAERKKGLDAHHRTLQNLRYRESRLKEEVKLCQNYQCLGLGKMTDKESQFILEFSSIGTKSHHHSQQLDMLKEELEKRRWLDAQKSALQEKRRKIKAEMKERHLILKQLPRYLNVAQQACSPLSQLILNTDWMQRTYTIHGQLPRALSLIYWQFRSLVSAGVLSPSTELLFGREFSARATYGGLVVERSIASLTVMIHGADVVFHTLPSLGNTVVVQPSDGTLVNLFRGDSGDRLHTSAMAWRPETVGIGKDASFPHNILGRPFGWAQWLGGCVTGTIACGKLEPSCRLVALRLQDRLASTTALREELDTLSRTPCPMSNPCRLNHLETVDVPPWLNYSWAVPTSNSYLSTSELYCSTYKCTLQTPRKEFVAIIKLSPEYPYHAPRFFLQPRDGSAETHDPRLKNIEAEINAKYDCDDDSKDSLLERQLSGFKVMVVAPFRTIIVESLFKRTVWGRGRNQHLYI